MQLPAMPSLRLDGRRAVVTGASRGIGLAAAAALAQAGAQVVLVARSSDQLEQAADDIRARGGVAQTACLDVSDLAAVSRFFATQAAFHILVSNAGTNRPKPLFDVTEADYDAVLNLNLKSAFFVAQCCAKRMALENIKGSLIHMGSQMGLVGAANRSLYCASKWGLEGLNKSLALDLACYGIRSNVIAPTFIDTPMTQPFFADDSFKSAVLSKIKLGRIGRVEDIMGAVLLLAGDASALMTGSTITIDGGWTAD